MEVREQSIEKTGRDDTLSQMSKLRESRLEDQVDHHIDKILKILCKVLYIEAISEVAEIQPGQQRVNSRPTVVFKSQTSGEIMH